MSIELVMPSNHLILCCPLLLPPSVFLSIRVFSNESVLHIRWPKYWSFSFNISPSDEYSRLISFKLTATFHCMERLKLIEWIIVHIFKFTQVTVIYCIRNSCIYIFCLYGLTSNIKVDFFCFHYHNFNLGLFSSTFLTVREITERQTVWKDTEEKRRLLYSTRI